GVGECPELLAQFSKSNQTLIKRSRAPYTLIRQQVGGRWAYEIYHVGKIQYGGMVFDVDNLRINTPKNHIRLYK
ncbi:type VI secretion system tube protein Hcp, partial [Salmonella enterica]|nr:type VI secretion system tube protein Hcp [Salmonella enterica]